jgi:hypothetical protein
MYPTLPEGVIENTLVQWAKNPQTFDEVCEEFKRKPVPPKERENTYLYDTTESGNDLPWGLPPENN